MVCIRSDIERRPCARVHAANGFDLALRDRLLVGDDRERLERGRRQPRVLSFEDEALDVRRQVRVGLVAVATGHLHQHEAPPVSLVLGGERGAQLFDARDGQLEELGEEAGVDRVGRGHDDCLDDAARLVGSQTLGGFVERVVVHGYSGSEPTVSRPPSRALSGSSHSARLAASRAVSPSRNRRTRRSPNVSNCSRSTTPCL